MFEKAKPGRDAFTFSLRGMSAIASFIAAPAITHHRINRILDDRLSQIEPDQLETVQEIGAIRGRFWILGRRRTA